MHPPSQYSMGYSIANKPQNSSYSVLHLMLDGRDSEVNGHNQIVQSENYSYSSIRMASIDEKRMHPKINIWNQTFKPPHSSQKSARWETFCWDSSKKSPIEPKRNLIRCEYTFNFTSILMLPTFNDSPRRGYSFDSEYPRRRAPERKVLKSWTAPSKYLNSKSIHTVTFTFGLKSFWEALIPLSHSPIR